MHLKDYIRIYDNVVSDSFCDKLIKYGNSKQEQIGLTGGLKAKDKESLQEQELNDLKQKRDSNIVWLSEKWLYKYIHYYVNGANYNSGWNFQWNFSENIRWVI